VGIARISGLGVRNLKKLKKNSLNKTLKIYIEADHKSDLILYLGNPKEAPEYPTLKEYLTDLGYDPENEDSLWDYSIELGLCELEVEELKKNGVSPNTHLGNLEETLDEHSEERANWIETIYSMTESPAAKMKTFLEQELPQRVSGIHIVEGVQGDGNLHYATAGNLEAVKRLEDTLTNMGHTVEVIAVKI
jgi:hypothetical protein